MAYEFLAGPMVYVAFALFFAGLALQVLRFRKLTRSKPQRTLPAPKVGAAPKKSKQAKGKAEPTQPLFWRLVALAERWGRPFDRLWLWGRRTIAGTHPVMTTVTVVFHVLLFLTPLLALAHNELIASSIGFSLPSLPEAMTDVMTFIVISCALIFFYRRLFLRRVRALTSAYDYFVLLVTALPFVTGFFCYHQWFAYKHMLVLHVASGELMLILIPFTRLGHALFFFLYRFTIGSEYSFGQGRRAW